MSAFEELGLQPEIIKAVEDDDWLFPTPIQGECIPYILGGRDVCAAAETGSGKTGAFGLPCLQIVHETLRSKAVVGPSVAQRERTIGPDINDKDSFVMINSDASEVKCDDQKRWCGVRCNPDVCDGKYQWEVTIIGNGLCRVGVSTGVANLDLGKDTNGWGFGGTGKKAWSNKFDDYGTQFGPGDVVGVLLDRENETVEFCVNGKLLGVAFVFNPKMKGQPVQPHICGKGFHVALHFEDLSYPVEGFTPLAEIDPSHSLRSRAAGLEGAGVRHPTCLILEPTRDLAMQTYECCKHYSKYLEAPQLRLTLCVGGVDERKQRRDIQMGVDIVVGTIQKITQWTQRNELDLTHLKFLVLDEADDLVKNDDRNMIPRIKKAASKNSTTKIQTLFFSATLHSPAVRKAIDELTVDAVWCDLKGRPTVPDTVHAVILNVDPENPPRSLQGLHGKSPKLDGVHRGGSMSQEEQWSYQIKMLKPQLVVAIADRLKMESCLVFCRTNLDCDNFEAYLNTLGGGRTFKGKAEGGLESRYSCVVLAGMRDQNERIANLKYFKDGDVRFLVCTDVAARGIDIQALPYLIMMTMPDDVEQWIHRVGRVGRADAMGLAISLVGTKREKVWYHTCSNRGKGCSNTRLKDEGGCCIWYDEPKILAELEAKFGLSLARMDPDTFGVQGLDDSSTSKRPKIEGSRKALDSRLRNEGETMVVPMKTGGATGVDSAIYGRRRRDELSTEAAELFEMVSPAAKELAAVEAALQVSFVTNR